jgi:hypothetical protein
MTFFELAELLRENINAGMGAVTLYLTVVTTYLVAAYLAGERLTRFQTFLTTSLFIVFALVFTFGSVAFFRSSTEITARFGNEVGISTFPIQFAWIIGCAEIFGILGSLKFMFDVRNKKGVA